MVIVFVIRASFITEIYIAPLQGYYSEGLNSYNIIVGSLTVVKQLLIN